MSTTTASHAATKVCVGCNRTLPLSAFQVNCKSSDGHIDYCKACTRRRNRMNGDFSGWVYIISTTDTAGFTYHKIGVSKKDPMVNQGRFSGMHTSNPFDIALVYAQEVEDNYGTEKYLHEFFADQRYRNEFFILSEDDVATAIDIIKAGTVYYI